MRKTVIQHVLSRLSATSLRRNPSPLGASLSCAACGNGVRRRVRRRTNNLCEPYRARTFEKSAPRPSAIVGCAIIASRKPI